MYLLCLIKISHKISYRTYFCLSRWNAVPSTSHLSRYSFPPTPLPPSLASPTSNTSIVIPAGLRQQCRSILHLRQGVPSPLLWLAMGRPGDARGASATLGSLLHLVSDATAVSSWPLRRSMPPSMPPLYLLYACYMLYNACPILTAAHHPINIRTAANVVSGA